MKSEKNKTTLKYKTTMYNIFSIHSGLFAEAKKYDSQKQVSSYAFLVCTIISTLETNYLSYIFFSVSVILQFFIRYRFIQIKRIIVVR